MAVLVAEHRGPTPLTNQQTPRAANVPMVELHGREAQFVYAMDWLWGGLEGGLQGGVARFA
jgi:hypothetical protein